MKKIIFLLFIFLIISCGPRTDYFENCKGDENCILEDYRELKDAIVEDLEDGYQDGDWYPQVMKGVNVVNRLSFEKSERIRLEIIEISADITRALNKF